MSEELDQGQAGEVVGGANADTVLFGNEAQGQAAGGGASQGQGQQAGDGQGQAADKTADKEGDKSGVPEGNYDFKMPEGVDVDEGLAAALSPEFKELGLTNQQAQRLVDKYIEAQSKRMEAQGEQWSETISGWVDEAKADKEIGGQKWDGTVVAARRAVEQFGTPQLAEYLNATGGGNHVEMIRFMAKVGALLGEDKPASGNAGAGSRAVDAASILFSNDIQKPS